jgi:hypothetical protein
MNKKNTNKIAILSFGGLVTNTKKTAALVKTKWTNKNGPQVPIEMCRVSKTEKLVLAVSEENGVNNAVYFATAKETDLNKAIANFMKIENIGEKQIGVLDLKQKVASERANKFANVSRNIAQWAKKAGYDGVIVNLLGRAFKDRINVPFTVENAVKYVQGQPAKVKKEQVAYLKSIPAGINTPVLDLLKGKK